MSRSAKVVLYTMGTLNELSDLGFVSGDDPLTSDGVEMFQYLKKKEFHPTEDETKWAVHHLVNKHIENE